MTPRGRGVWFKLTVAAVVAAPLGAAVSYELGRIEGLRRIANSDVIHTGQHPLPKLVWPHTCERPYLAISMGHWPEGSQQGLPETHPVQIDCRWHNYSA